MTTEAMTAIATIVEANPALVLVDEKKFEDFYEHVKAEAAATPIDLSTDKGRKAIASMAHKIARTKTAIDDAGKKLNEEARAKINAVDEARRKIRDRFDALKEEVRRPLTEWEEAEADRIERVNSMRRYLDTIHRELDGKTAQEVQALYADVRGMAFAEADYGADTKTLDDVRLIAMDRLEGVYANRVREEHDRAELARLRQEQEERAAADAKRQAEAEQRQREAEEARRAEELKAQEEARRKAEQERIEREARERADAEAKARIEAAERAAKEAEEAAARKIEEERQAREREKAEQERIEREAREAEAARQADREHRAKIMGAAKAAIIEIGIEEPKAKEIVLAIAAGNIPHISIRF